MKIKNRNLFILLGAIALFSRSVEGAQKPAKDDGGGGFKGLLSRFSGNKDPHVKLRKEVDQLKARYDVLYQDAEGGVLKSSEDLGRDQQIKGLLKGSPRDDNELKKLYDKGIKSLQDKAVTKAVYEDYQRDPRVGTVVNKDLQERYKAFTSSDGYKKTTDDDFVKFERDVRDARRALDHVSDKEFADSLALSPEKRSAVNEVHELTKLKAGYIELKDVGDAEKNKVLNQIDRRIDEAVAQASAQYKNDLRQKNIMTSLKLTGGLFVLGGLVSLVVLLAMRNTSSGGGDASGSAIAGGVGTAGGQDGLPAPTIIDAETGIQLPYHPAVVKIHEGQFFGRGLTTVELTEFSDLWFQHDAMRAEYEKIIAPIMSTEGRVATDEENARLQSIEQRFASVVKKMWLDELDIRYELTRRHTDDDLAVRYQAVARDVAAKLEAVRADRVQRAGQEITPDDLMRAAQQANIEQELVYLDAVIAMEKRAQELVNQLALDPALSADEKMNNFTSGYNNIRKEMRAQLDLDDRIQKRADTELFETSKDRVARTIELRLEGEQQLQMIDLGMATDAAPVHETTMPSGVSQANQEGAGMAIDPALV